jgi:hypothetical protein
MSPAYFFNIDERSERRETLPAIPPGNWKQFAQPKCLRSNEGCGKCSEDGCLAIEGLGYERSQELNPDPWLDRHTAVSTRMPSSHNFKPELVINELGINAEGIVFKHDHTQWTTTSIVRKAGISVFCGISGMASALEAGGHLDSWHLKRLPVLGELNWICNLCPDSEHMCTYLSLCVFTAAATGLYYNQISDRRQDRYLMMGITSGVIFGLASHQDLQDAMLKNLCLPCVECMRNGVRRTGLDM